MFSAFRQMEGEAMGAGKLVAGKLVAGKLVAGAAIAATLACAAGARAQTMSRPLSDAEKAYIGGEVAKQLRDPESARFKWTPIKTEVGKLPRAYCGLVNGRNGLGGYVGDAPFVAHLRFDNGRMIISSVDILDSDEIWALKRIDVQRAGCDPADVYAAQ